MPCVEWAVDKHGLKYTEQFGNFIHPNLVFNPNIWKVLEVDICLEKLL
jgi:hypothetical protein